MFIHKCDNCCREPKGFIFDPEYGYVGENFYSQRDNRDLGEGTKVILCKECFNRESGSLANMATAQTFIPVEED